MPNVLLLKISPPMQSWGIGDLYEKNRKTNRFPTKSAVVGMMASALGWDRNHDLSVLSKLNMSVRIDSPGRMQYDFQIIKKPGDANGKLSYRWYLSDAVFLIALQSEDLDLLRKLEDALLHPAFNVFAGRKAFPLNPDLVQGLIQDTTAEDLLSHTDWRGHGEEPARLEIIRDAKENDVDVSSMHDVPIDFRLDHRDWASRPIVREWISLKEDVVPVEVKTEEHSDWLDEDDGLSEDAGSLDNLDFMTGEDVS